MNTLIDEILSQFNYRTIWANLLEFEATGRWKNDQKPDWLVTLQSTFNASHYQAIFVTAAYRHVAMQALKQLDAKE